MNEMLENVIGQAVEYLKEEVLPQIAEEVVPRIIEGAKETGKEMMAGLVAIFVELKSKGTVDNIVVETFEMLNKERLVNVAKNNTVEEANGIAAYMLEKDDMVYVYLANVKDRELLSEKENKYVIIKAECIKNDIKALFGEDKLIILQ